MKRPTAQRDRLRKAVRERCDPCHICGQPIDYDAPHLDPGEFVVDHVIPLARGGFNTLENAAAAHRHCNRQKADKILGEVVPVGPPAPVQTSNIW